MRIACSGLAVLVLLCGAGGLRAEEPVAQPAPEPLTPEQAADAVLEAVVAEDDAALKALAGRGDPDPWLVADELCHRGEQDAAAAFAKAAPRKAVEKLPAYVGARRARAPETEARTCLEGMSAAVKVGDLPKAIEQGESARTALDSVCGIRVALALGRVLRKARRNDEAARVLLEAEEAAAALGWLGGVARSLRGRGACELSRSNANEALSSLERSLATAKEVGSREYVAWASAGLGLLLFLSGDSDKGLSLLEEAHPVLLGLGKREDAATVLGALGTLYGLRGETRRAIAVLERAVVTLEETDSRWQLATMLKSLGMFQQNLGEYAQALSTHERSLRVWEELGKPAATTLALTSLSSIHKRLGDYGKALSYAERSLALSREAGDRMGVGVALQEIGLLQERLGNYARAHASYEEAGAEFEAHGVSSAAASSLFSLGSMQLTLGDGRRALSYLERSLAVVEELGAQEAIADTLLAIGRAQRLLGDRTQALSLLERSLAMMEALESRQGIASSFAELGAAHLDFGNPAQALAYYERSLALREELAARPEVARAHGEVGKALRALGNHTQARTHLQRGLRVARRLRSRPLQVTLGTSLALTHFESGEAARALMAAREALREFEDLAGGLAEEEGARTREAHSDLFAVGTLAALRLEEPAEALRFVESGRSGSLLETLGGGRASSFAKLPEALRQSETEAQAGEARARLAHNRALDSGDLKALRKTRGDLDEAMDLRREVAARIQREAKRVAGVFYPRAAPAEEIQGWLGDGEVLVLYVLCLDEALAFVLTNDSERVVPLGTVASVEAACEGLPFDDSSDAAGVLARFRGLLVDPLDLPETTTTVLVSPEGPLCYVPFGALFPQTVAVTPSGTTHVLLREDEHSPGTQVLALGDPDYGTRGNAVAAAVYRSGARLSALPHTRDEAMAVGDTVLLGADANEVRLREALGQVKRWRAVHLACHGLVDAERPTLSSLALTPTSEEDGFLTALEVSRMEVPADLVVLSACETGKGEVLKGEGIVGLTRAFMYAGSPRVVCSLWPVPDEATQALMKRFYELWNPKEGEGLGAAAALKKAQEYIRAYERPTMGESRERGPLRPTQTSDEEVRSERPWEHPYYWAAWVLWGLPD